MCKITFRVKTRQRPVQAADVITRCLHHLHLPNVAHRVRRIPGYLSSHTMCRSTDRQLNCALTYSLLTADLQSLPVMI